jgi:hypothetical protein
MVALQIRDVPDDVRDSLAAHARARGMSLQALLLEMVIAEARRAHNLAVLERFEHRRRGGTTLTEGELRDVLDSARQERVARPRNP